LALAIHSLAWHPDEEGFLSSVHARTLPMTALPLGVSARQGLLALVAGLLGAAAFWPLTLWPLILVSIVLFLHLLRDADSQTARNIGLLYSIALAGGTMYWLFFLFGVFAIPLVAIMAAYFGLLATLVGMTRGMSVPARIVLTALFAVGIEWLRGDAWYLRFPWYTPLHALAAVPPCVAGTRWLGTYGLSYVVWLIAAASVFATRRYLAGFLLLPVVWFLLPADGDPDRRVLLLQTEEMEGVERIIPRITVEKVDLAVLPEYAYMRSPEYAIASPRGPAVLARKTSSPVVFGAVEGTYARMPFSNVAAVIDSDGTLLGTFPKQRPVPLMLDGTPGDRLPVFEVDGAVLGVAICYDFDAPAVCGALVRSGATVLAAPTMDTMSWGRVQHEHHALLFRLRAVENDRWVLRAATSGRTEVISPTGMPSKEGIAIGATGHIVLSFAHRDSWVLGSWLSFLGPIAAGGTGVFFVLSVLARMRAWWRAGR
jgi:apolipoprotein N-acyltransferase